MLNRWSLVTVAAVLVGLATTAVGVFSSSRFRSAWICCRWRK